MTSIEKFIDLNQSLFIKTATDIWEYAEVGYQEFKSAACMAELLKSYGFRVQQGVGDAHTAFIAEYGTGAPIIGLMAEYDALPNLSQKLGVKQEALKPGANGHGCGHNLLGTAALAAAIAVKEAIESGEVQGTIRLYGTPAEIGRAHV